MTNRLLLPTLLVLLTESLPLVLRHCWYLLIVCGHAYLVAAPHWHRCLVMDVVRALSRLVSHGQTKPTFGALYRFSSLLICSRPKVNAVDLPPVLTTILLVNT